MLSCRNKHLCIPPIFINSLLSFWHLLKLKYVCYIKIFKQSLKKISLMSHTSGHMAWVICTEMLEAAGIAAKDVIKHSTAQRLRNSVLCFTQNIVLCYNEQSIDQCYLKEQAPFILSYHTKHVSTQCRLNVELYILWQAEFMNKSVL